MAECGCCRFLDSGRAHARCFCKILCCVRVGGSLVALCRCSRDPGSDIGSFTGTRRDFPHAIERRSPFSKSKAREERSLRRDRGVRSRCSDRDRRFAARWKNMGLTRVLFGRKLTALARDINTV